MENESIATWDLPFAAQPVLELHADMASLTLLPVEPGGAPRLVAEGKAARKVRPEIELSGGVTRVDIGWQGDLAILRSFWDWGGKLHITAYVPAGVRATLHADAGKLRARDLAGCELSIFADAGRVELANLSGRIKVRADAGKIEGSRLAGSLDVEIDAGEVRLGVIRLDPGTHRVRTELGAARIELARGLAVHIDSHATLGDVKVDYPETPRAAAVLAVSTELGVVQISESSEPAQAAPEERGPTPYRAPPPPDDAPPDDAAAVPEVQDDALERVLEMVAKGKLTPRDAGDLIRALGRG